MQIPTKKLNNGVDIPVLGFGTWRLKPGEEAESAVELALGAGYRHIDTAQIYGNEQSVGAAIVRSGIPREEIFITSKLWDDNHFYDEVAASFEETLHKLKTDYIDLFLIHFPVTHTREPAWLKLQELYRSGSIKAIGVSNYTEKHLDELLKQTNVIPAVNQIEVHPFLIQEPLRKYCLNKTIAVEAYSSLAHGYDMHNEIISKVAKKYSKTYAQIMLRWGVQHDMIVLPKSTHKQRIVENAQIFDFEIDSDDMFKIDALNRNIHIAWNPVNVP